MTEGYFEFKIQPHEMKNALINMHVREQRPVQIIAESVRQPQSFPWGGSIVKTVHFWVVAVIENPDGYTGKDPMAIAKFDQLVECLGWCRENSMPIGAIITYWKDHSWTDLSHYLVDDGP